MDFGDAEDDVTLETIEEFEQMVGKHQAIIASSSYWGEQSFPTANLQHDLAARLTAAAFSGRRGTDRTNKNHGPDRFSLIEIIAGQVGCLHRQMG